MKKVFDSVKSAISETSGVFGEGFQSAADLLTDTLHNFYDVKNITKEKLTSLANDLITLSPLIEQTGYRAKEMNMGVSIPPRIVFHFEKFQEVSKENIEKILAENGDKPLLKIIVSTLVSADEFQNKLSLGNFKFSEIDIKLGVPPEVNVKFVASKNNV